LSELLIPGTEYIYKYPIRTRMETEGGTKIALKKGAKLEEGIYIMKKMLKPAMENNSMFRKTGTILRDELDLDDMVDIHKAALEDSWLPGQRRMLDRDHKAMYARLAEKTTMNQVATAKYL
jgi:hypothetical protein